MNCGLLRDRYRVIVAQITAVYETSHASGHRLPAPLHPTRIYSVHFKHPNISIISEKNREAAKGLCPNEQPFLLPFPKRRWYKAQAMNLSYLLE